MIPSAFILLSFLPFLALPLFRFLSIRAAAGRILHLLCTGTGSPLGSSGHKINPRINFNDHPLERDDDFELLLETDVTDTVQFRTGGYDRCRTTLPG